MGQTSLKLIEHEETGPDMSVLDRKKPRQGLTVSQEKMAQELFRGASNLDAYKVAYNPTATENKRLYSTACHSADHPKVKARLHQLILKQEQKVYDESEDLTEFILEQTRSIARDVTERTQDRLKALELLGKTRHVQLFKETVIHEKDDRTSKQIMQDIMRTLENATKEKD